MVFGRKKSHKKNASSGGATDFNEARKSIKVSTQDAERLKIRTINVHDPILNAVNEDQPFQEASFAFASNGVDNRKSLSYFASTNRILDSFGNPIVKPDISNPTRSRDERPMDTIRSFEYAITGDQFYRQNLETPLYGWSPRPNFQYKFNPYDNSSTYNANSADAIPRAVKYNSEQPVYQVPVREVPELKKKKTRRSIFGRRKK